MYERVRAYVKKYHMLQEKDHVIAGVSGGADSVCLLFMLVKLQKEMRFGLTVVHIHHGLRGESADADENYVRALCEKLDVELLAFHEDVGRYAKEQKLTLEEAGRNVRRHIFEEVCHRKNGTRIALAHHQNDNAETLLWNLSRGCGLKGIGGISPVDGKYIRPLLGVRRQEIEEYLKENNIEMDIENLKVGDFSYESGYKLANELINKKNTPTAIFAVTDNLAIAAIDCLKDKGLNIPKDVAVVSIGDTRISEVVSPKLTTIHYHYKTSGRKSAEIILELLKSSIKTSKTIKKNIKLSYILIERNSA